MWFVISFVSIGMVLQYNYYNNLILNIMANTKESPKGRHEQQSPTSEKGSNNNKGGDKGSTKSSSKGEKDKGQSKK